MLCRLLLVAAVSAVTANRPDVQSPMGKADKRIDPEIADISGYYTCKGAEASGKNYTGIAVIAKKNDVYVIQWVVGVGNTFTGIGIRQGNTFAASWALGTDKGTVRGVNVYKVEPGPRLVGRWATLPGPGVTQSETLTFLKALEKEEE